MMTKKYEGTIEVNVAKQGTGKNPYAANAFSSALTYGVSML